MICTVVVLEGSNATERQVDASPGTPFVDAILDDKPRFVGSWQEESGVVLLAGRRTQEEGVAPPVARLPPFDSHREAAIYGIAVAVRTDEEGEVIDLTLDDYEALCARDASEALCARGVSEAPSSAEGGDDVL